MNRPLASILINNFNYGRFLREAIDSALAQTYPHVEVIVVDDGSTDGSRTIIEEYGDRIIPVLKSNGGQNTTFNAGFTASRGDIVCLLDADDSFLPQKVQVVVDALERESRAGWLVHNYTKFREGGDEQVIDTYQAEQLVDHVRQTTRGGYGLYCPPTSGLVFRRSLLARFFPVPEDLRVTDNYLKFVALTLSPVLTLPDVLMRQRMHDANVYTGVTPLVLARRRYVFDTDIGLAMLQLPSARRLGLTNLASGLNNGWAAGELTTPEVFKRILQQPEVTPAERLRLALKVSRTHWRPGNRLRRLRDRLRGTKETASP